MEKETYNGWSNYATWRVNLEMIDGWADYHMSEPEHETFESVRELAEHLKDYAEEQIANYVDDSSKPNLAEDYALAFLNEVNWYEIAQHIAEDYPQILAQNAPAN